MSPTPSAWENEVKDWMFSPSFLPALKGWSWLWWSGPLCGESCSATWRRLKIFVLDLIAQKPKLTIDYERIAIALSHFHLSFSVVNGGWPIILKLAENSFWFNHQFFSSYLKFLIWHALSVYCCLRTATGASKYLYLAIWWAIYWQLK